MVVVKFRVPMYHAAVESHQSSGSVVSVAGEFLLRSCGCRRSRTCVVPRGEVESVGVVIVLTSGHLIRVLSVSTHSTRGAHGVP